MFSYQEFCSLVCPKKEEYSKVFKNKPYLNPNRIKLTDDTLSILRSLFTSIIEAELTTETKKKQLTSVAGFSNYESYEIIKGKFKSFILKDDVIYQLYKINKNIFSYTNSCIKMVY